MLKKKTHEEFMQELKSIGNNKITVLGIYNGNKTPLLVECNKCHKQYYTQPSVLLHNSGCRDCMPHKSKPPVKKKKSEEQFLKEVEVVNPNVEILSEYKGASVKVQCKCKICNNIWETTPSVLLAGHGCRKCATKRNAEKGTLSHKEFMERFYKCNNQYVEIIGKYKGSDIKIKCKCLICGEEFETAPYRLLNGTKHEKCANKLSSEKRKCDYEDLKQRINNVNPNIELLGEYINFHTKMDFRCVCGEIHQATPDHLLHGGLCYKCGRIKASNNYKRTQQEFVDEVMMKNKNIEVVGNYTTIKNNIDVECKVCGYKWSPIAETLIRKDPCGCPKCSGRIKTNDEFVNDVKIKQPTLKLLNKYVNSVTKLKFHCTVCDEDIYITPNKIMNGQGCPNCARSHGELLVSSYLTHKKINYQQQYRIYYNDSRYYFDFALILPNNNQIALIEYDGEQHYQPVDFAGKGEEWAESHFADTQLRDSIKDQYCKDNNIPLLRIPYWDYNNIDKILSDFLDTLKVSA